MKNTNLKKLLALFLALVMCFSLLPVSAFAEETDGDEDEAVVEWTEEKEPAAEDEEDILGNHDQDETPYRETCDAETRTGAGTRTGRLPAAEPPDGSGRRHAGLSLRPLRQ